MRWATARMAARFPTAAAARAQTDGETLAEPAAPPAGSAAQAADLGPRACRARC